VQFAFFAFIVYRSVLHSIGSASRVASLDSLCPMGGVATFWNLVTMGRYVPKTHASNVVLLAGLGVSVLLAGGAFCGWMCPMGTLSDLLTSVRKRLRIGEIGIPNGVSRYLGLLRFVVLGAVLFETARLGTLVFANFDPYRAIFGLYWIFSPSSIGAIVWGTTVLVLAGMFLVDRFWCRFLCPLGAVISLIQPLAIFKVRRDPELCINCGECSRVCPVKLPVDRRVSPGATCAACMDCVSSCPVPGALYVGTAEGRFHNTESNTLTPSSAPTGSHLAVRR
jgi:polyferredoxin